MNPEYAAHQGKQLGRIERVIADSGLVVIAVRPEMQSTRLTSGTRLESRSIQYEITGLVEVGPNPSPRYITARVVTGKPATGDAVLLPSTTFNNPIP